MMLMEEEAVELGTRPLDDDWGQRLLNRIWMVRRRRRRRRRLILTRMSWEEEDDDYSDTDLGYDDL
jgi:hypothetical protein